MDSAPTMDMQTTDTPLARALERENLTRVGLARLIGVVPQMVSLWAVGRRRVTAEWACAIERETLGLITRAELRPDLFGPLR